MTPLQSPIFTNPKKLAAKMSHTTLDVNTKIAMA